MSASPRAAAPSDVARPPLLMIIYHNPDYYPPTVNAVSILREYFQVCLVCRNIRPRFRQWPADVTVRREGEYGSEAARLQASGRAKVGEYRRFVQGVRRAIEEFRPRLIYAYEPLGFAAARFAGAARRGIPIFYHLHEFPDEGYRGGMLQALVGGRARRRTRAAEAVIFPEANRARVYLGRARDPRAALIVPNYPAREFAAGLTMHELTALAAERLRRRELVYFGSLGAAHANLEAVQALAEFDGRLSLIGWAAEDFAAELARNARELGVAPRLELSGPLAHAQLPGRARGAAIGLAMHKPASRNLEYSVSATNKLFEYAACGLPAIVADLPNYRDYLRDERWIAYADPCDPGSIARGAQALLANPEAYLAMSLAARQSFEQRYNYESVFAPVLRRILLSAEILPHGGAVSG